MASPLRTIVATAALGGLAASFALGATAVDAACAKALNTSPNTRHEFTKFDEFHKKWMSKLNQSNVREHGWELYAGVVSAAGPGCPASSVPLWLSWATKTDLFVDGPKVDGPKSGGQARQITLTPSATLNIGGKAASSAGIVAPAAGATPGAAKMNFPFQLPGSTERVFFSTAQYNPAAEKPDLVHMNDLAHAPQRMMAAYKQHVPSMIDNQSPDTAIIVKPIWLPVEPGNASTCVPVWNADAIPSTFPGNLGAYASENWAEKVQVGDPSKPGNCLVQTGRAAPVVSVTEFFSRPIDSVNAAALRVVLGSSPGAAAKAGNVALLVGFHVISKEVDSWSWNTFWWEPKQYRNGPLSKGRPNLEAPWSNYVMNASLNEAQLPKLDSQGKCDVSGIGAVYNPYQEAALPTGDPMTICGKHVALGGLASNCRSCHSLAGYPTPDNPVVTIQPAQDWLLGYLKNKTQTGFLWSIPRYLYP